LIIVYKTPSPFSLPLVHTGQVSLQKCAMDFVMLLCTIIFSPYPSKIAVNLSPVY